MMNKNKTVEYELVYEYMNDESELRKYKLRIWVYTNDESQLFEYELVYENLNDKCKIL